MLPLQNEVCTPCKPLMQWSCMCRIKIAVGYMLRYSAVAQEAKRILSNHSSQALAINGRFAGAYSAINKEFWYLPAIVGQPVTLHSHSVLSICLGVSP